MECHQALFVKYNGTPLKSRQRCFWKVQVWDASEQPPSWRQAGSWSMGLLNDADWTANYISYRDNTPIHNDVTKLYLPAAKQYRKEFTSHKKIRHGTIYATAIGIYKLHQNGKRVSDAYLVSGWTDYRQRAYYNTYDVTDFVQAGQNANGAWVADGWYSDMLMVGTFECSDLMVNQLLKNVVWTQRANFLDLPTNFSQPDERMGWTGDAQAYVATAAYNADIGALYTKWLRPDEAAYVKLVIEFRAIPEHDTTSQFFWSHLGRGFNGQQQTKRMLRESNQVQSYLFTIQGEGPVRKLRFDPFATFDKYAKAGGMMFNSIAAYCLS